MLDGLAAAVPPDDVSQQRVTAVILPALRALAGSPSSPNERHAGREPCQGAISVVTGQARDRRAVGPARRPQGCDGRAL